MQRHWFTSKGKHPFNEYKVLHMGQELGFLPPLTFFTPMGGPFWADTNLVNEGSNDNGLHCDEACSGLKLCMVQGCSRVIAIPLGGGRQISTHILHSPVGELTSMPKMSVVCPTKLNQTINIVCAESILVSLLKNQPFD